MTRSTHRLRPGRAAAVVTVVLAFAALLAGTSAAPANAAWTATAQRSAPVAMASWGSSFTLTSGAGSVATDGSKYTITSVLSAGTGYVDLVNTGTVPASLAMTVSVGSVVGVSPVSVCSQPWNTASGACPGTSTMIALSVVLGSSTGTYTSPAQLPPNGRVYTKVAAGGVAGQVGLSTLPVTPRAPMDRTTS